MLATEWGMGNVLWTMFALLIWCMAIWIFITVFADIFRRGDIGGGAKALWILLIVAGADLRRPGLSHRSPSDHGYRRHPRRIELRVVEPGAGRFRRLADGLSPVRIKR